MLNSIIILEYWIIDSCYLFILYRVIASVWINTFCNGGKYINNICPTIESVTATRDILLENKPITQ